jgi:hypothetical protein
LAIFGLQGTREHVEVDVSGVVGKRVRSLKTNLSTDCQNPLSITLPVYGFDAGIAA